MLGGGGRVRPLTAHSKLEPLRDGQGASDKPRDQREDWKRFRISWVKCDSGKMLSQHACMSSMKIFIRKVNTFLSSSLSYRKEESTYFIVLTFTKCSTNTHASSPNRLGDGPSPAARSTWRPRESKAPGGWQGQPTARPPVGGEDPLEAVAEKGTGFPRSRVTRGRRQNFPLLFHPHQPSVDQKNLGEMSSSGRKRASGFEQRGQLGAPFGAEGRKAQRRPGSWT